MRKSMFYGLFLTFSSDMEAYLIKETLDSIKTPSPLLRCCFSSWINERVSQICILIFLSRHQVQTTISNSSKMGHVREIVAEGCSCTKIPISAQLRPNFSSNSRTGTYSVTCCWESGRHLPLDVSCIVGPLNYSRCDTKHRLPCTITPFY